MSDNPRSYRVPVLRLSDMPDSQQDDAVHDDAFDFKQPVSDSGPQPAATPHEPPRKPLVPVTELPEHEVSIPVAAYNAPVPQTPQTQQSYVRPRPAPIDPNAPLRAPLPKVADPFAKPKPDEPLDIWEQAEARKTLPPQPQAPRPPAVATPPTSAAPLPPLPPPPLEETPIPQASVFSYGTTQPTPPPAPVAPTEESKTQAILDQALTSMGFGELAVSGKQQEVSAQEAAHGEGTRIAIYAVADTVDEIGVPASPPSTHVAPLAPPAEPDVQPTASSGSNLASLRERVLRAGGGHKEHAPATPPKEQAGLAAARAQALAASDLHAVRDVHALVADGTPAATGAASAPVPEKRILQTEHARAIAGVAEALHAIQHDEDMPAPTPAPVTPQPEIPRTQDPYVVQPAPAPAENAGISSPRRTGVPMIRTFKSDVERTITHGQVSVVKMISDQETERHGGAPDVVVRKTTKQHFSIASPILLTLTIVLLVGAVAVGVFMSIVVLRPSVEDTVNSLFFANDTVDYDGTGQDRKTLLQGLTRVRDSAALPNGQVLEIVLTEKILEGTTDTGLTRVVTGQEFMERVNVRAPATLVRTIQDSFITGVHIQNKAEPFIVFRVGYYENAFAGMLLWEETMDTDLSPLFGAPVTRAATVPVAPRVTGTTTASGTPPVPEPDPFTVDTRDLGTFDDETIANTPARVLRDADGTMRVIWAMPDTSTIIITTNVATFEEIRDRMDAR